MQHGNLSVAAPLKKISLPTSSINNYQSPRETKVLRTIACVVTDSTLNESSIWTNRSLKEHNGLWTGKNIRTSGSRCQQKYIFWTWYNHCIHELTTATDVVIQENLHMFLLRQARGIQGKNTFFLFPWFYLLVYKIKVLIATVWTLSEDFFEEPLFTVGCDNNFHLYCLQVFG